MARLTHHGRGRIGDRAGVRDTAIHVHVIRAAGMSVGLLTLALTMHLWRILRVRHLLLLLLAMLRLDLLLLLLLLVMLSRLRLIIRSALCVRALHRHADHGHAVWRRIGIDTMRRLLLVMLVVLSLLVRSRSVASASLFARTRIECRRTDSLMLFVTGRVSLCLDLDMLIELEWRVSTHPRAREREIEIEIDR